MQIANRILMATLCSCLTPAALNAQESFESSNLFASLARVTTNVPDAQMLSIASLDRRGAGWLLARGSQSTLGCVAPNSSSAIDWWVSPTAGGWMRIETYERGQLLAVAVDRAGLLQLRPIAQDVHQLWRPTLGNVADRFVLASAPFPGHCLSMTATRGVALQPIQFAPGQLWTSIVPPRRFDYQPFWRSLALQVIPSVPLPPARIELVNSHRNALVVLLADSRSGDEPTRLEIAPGASATVSLQRDAGTTILETFEIRSATGVWDRREMTTAVPAAMRYDLSVYEKHLQSIAIDRTGKSPNAIEDVNYVPKSVGWLAMPAGDALPENARIDVYARAKAAENPGAVRRIDFKELDEPASGDRLESILKEFESIPRRSF